MIGTAYLVATSVEQAKRLLTLTTILATETVTILALTTDITGWDVFPDTCGIYHLAVDVSQPLVLTALAPALATWLKSQSPGVVACVENITGQELSARLSVALGVPCVTDVLMLSDTKNYIRPLYGEAIQGVFDATCGMDWSVITIREKSFSPYTTHGKVSIQPLALELQALPSLEILSVETMTDQTIALEAADVVVAGGRGLKGPENFHLIESLAKALGAAVGASRAVVDAGWRPHHEQVGQTGKTVSPKLYIAVGLSGAIQHQVGMTNSQRIIVINRDADAPIFKMADLGIVGDALDILPALLNALAMGVQ